MAAQPEQFDPQIDQVTAGRAYEGEPTYQMIATHDNLIGVVVPP